MKKAQQPLLIVALTFALLLVTSFLVIAGINDRFSFSNERTNEDALPTLVSRVLEEPVDETLNSSYRLKLATNEMFLFYSLGEGPIDLKYTGEGDAFKSFRFARPDECIGKSCVCHCNAHLWDYSSKEPYLQLTSIQPLQDSKDQGFSCVNMICQEVKDVYFMNSRGVDAGFVEPVLNEFIDDTIQHIPFDIPILLTENTFKNVFLFDDEDDDEFEYSFYRQDIAFARSTLEKHRWSGGVVIGGMGLAFTERLADNKELRGPQIKIRLEQFKEHNIVGVCIYDQCLFEKALEEEEKRIEQEKLLKNLRTNFDLLEQSFLQSLPSCLDQAITLQQQSRCIYEKIQLQSLTKIYDEDLRSEEFLGKIKFYTNPELEDDQVFVQLIVSVKTGDRNKVVIEMISDFFSGLGSSLGIGESSQTDTSIFEGFVADQFEIPYSFPKKVMGGEFIDFDEELIIEGVDDNQNLIIGENSYTLTMNKLEDNLLLTFIPVEEDGEE